MVAQNPPSLDNVCMNWMEFTANIIDNVFSLPVALLLIVFLLREQIRELFRTVTNLGLEHGGTRLSLTRSLEHASEHAREGLAADGVEVLLAPTSSDDSGEENISGKLHEDPGTIGTTPSNTDAAAAEAEYLAEQYSYTWKLARSNPSSAIEVAWDRLIAEQVRRLAHDRGLRPADDMGLLNELNSRGVVNHAILSSAKDLNRIRFKVATAQMDPSPNEALQYVDIAWEVTSSLSYLRSEDAKSQSP